MRRAGTIRREPEGGPLPELAEGMELQHVATRPETAFHPAAREVYRGDAYTRDGGKGYRAAEHLRADDFDDPRSRIRGEGRAEA